MTKLQYVTQRLLGARRSVYHGIDRPDGEGAMRYFTADLHIGDKTIAHWRGFGSVEQHDAFVLARLVEGLEQDDELWILGDVCKNTVAAVSAVREAIPCGRVHIVVGNHDQRSKFVTCGTFASVDYYGQVGRVAREGYKFVMSHYPMLDWDRAYHGAYMLHGHIHSLPPEPPAPGEVPNPRGRESGGMGWRGYNERNRELGIRRFDVGLDANGYRPVSDEQIVAFFPDDDAWRAMHGLG